MQVGRLTHVARVRGVDLYVHWSVFVIAGVLLWRAPRGEAATLAGILAYLALLLLHESGHVWMARQRGFDAWSITLYPVFGYARTELPESRFEHALIAWGGVAAQAVVAIPIMGVVLLFGPSPFEPMNAVLAILGGYSVCLAAFNLLPVRPLDGSVAWGLIPAWLERRRRGKMRKARRIDYN